MKESEEITGAGVTRAMKKMKSNKATGPDGIPIEAWGRLGNEGVYILWDLKRKIPDKKEGQASGGKVK